MTVTVDCPICEDGKVTAEYSFRPEVRWHRDGSGSPSEEEIEIDEATCDCWHVKYSDSDRAMLDDLIRDKASAEAFDRSDDYPEDDDR